MSILDVDDGFGRFDYIVCHGVYSWVPAEVRDKILAICSRNLAPQGVAYVSYNTYPGWHAGGLARDLMAFHVRNSTKPRDSVQEARLPRRPGGGDPRSIDGLRRHPPRGGGLLSGVDDTYLYHEHLEETNNPFYFHQFMDAARAKGLEFLAEAKTPGMIGHLPQEAASGSSDWGRTRSSRAVRRLRHQPDVPTDLPLPSRGEPVDRRSSRRRSRR